MYLTTIDYDSKKYCLIASLKAISKGFLIQIEARIYVFQVYYNENLFFISINTSLYVIHL